jgi:hypothetical protein
MEQLVSHLMSRVFLDFCETSGSTRHDELARIYEKVVTRSYQFLEDWRHDIRDLRHVCDFAQTVVVANEICRICEKEYSRLLCYVSLSEWSHTSQTWMEQLNAEFGELSPADQSMGGLEVLLQRCRDGLPVRSAEARASADRLHPPLEPYWTLPSDSEPAENIPDDNEEFLLYCASLHKPAERERAYTKMQDNTTQRERLAGTRGHRRGRARRVDPTLPDEGEQARRAHCEVRLKGD